VIAFCRAPISHGTKDYEMRKLFLIKLLLLAWLTSGAAVLAAPHLTSDPQTGLPIYPGVRDPSPLPKAAVCGKQMQGDFYIVMGDKVDAVADWYAKHLAGFKKYHATSDGRTQDTFFKPDGTQEVTVTGSRGNTGEVFSISYGRFQPALSLREMASFNQEKRVCD
jgi:hypothetical protein